MEALILNLAYALYVLASLAPGGLRLRIGLALQGIVFIVWALLTENWSAAGWNVAFTGVNVFHAIRIIRDDRLPLGEIEARVREEMFPGLGRRDFLLLWNAGQSGTVPAGAGLCSTGDVAHDLVLVLTGSVRVDLPDGSTIDRPARCFVGELSFYTGQPASADVSAAADIDVHRWTRDDLATLEQLNSSVERALRDAMGGDIAQKLRSAPSASR